MRAATDAAADAFDAGGLGVLDFALRNHAAAVGGLLIPHYRAVADSFAERMFTAADVKGFRRAPQTKDRQDFFLALIQQWVTRFGAEKVVRVSATTKQRIRDAVHAGQDAGEGQAAIARRIRALNPGVNAMRSLIIARTETHHAASFAQDAALEALDLPDVKREWVAVEDGRTRETHVLADGQVRGQQEAFDVGGFKLSRPGDPAGPAREVINCRCVIAAVVPDD